jgi:hypothetical protein
MSKVIASLRKQSLERLLSLAEQLPNIDASEELKNAVLAAIKEAKEEEDAIALEKAARRFK